MLSCWGPNRVFMKCWVTEPWRHRMKSYSPMDCWGQLHIWSYHMISTEESTLGGLAFCSCLCVYDWLYWEINSSMICSSRSVQNSSNSMYDKSMLSCVIRCRSYQMQVSLKHNPWFFQLVFYSIDHSSAKVSNLSFTGFPRMSDSCFSATLILL